MSVDPGQSFNKFDERVLEQLACPVCYGALRLGISEQDIVCGGCGRSYPFLDGIPVLIADRATQPDRD
jgi:uncharacterized protein